MVVKGKEEKFRINMREMKIGSKTLLLVLGRQESNCRFEGKVVKKTTETRNGNRLAFSRRIVTNTGRYSVSE